MHHAKLVGKECSAYRIADTQPFLQRHKISAHMRGKGSYKQLVPDSAQTDKPSFQGSCTDRQGRSLVPLRKVTIVC